MTLYIGCCGFSLSRSRYYRVFNVVELQDTFYNPPDLEKLKSLRKEAPSDFSFTMKCWQAITHPLDSPTWRRAKVVSSKSLSDRYGFLRPTKEVFEAWELVVKGAKALGAKVVVIQTPPTFGYSEENFRNAMDFLASATTSDVTIGWEPRGTWLNNLGRVSEIVNTFRNLIHVVDPFKVKPVVVKEVTYFRLHGIGANEVNYNYKYTDEDLKYLRDMVLEYLRQSIDAYVLFNNVYMVQDAQRFKELMNLRV